MDFQFWLWIIVIIITLIARANKKKQEQAPPREEYMGPEGNEAPSRQPKPLTFEELLREIQGEKVQPKPRPEPVAESKPYDFTDYDDDLKEEEQPLEEVSYDARKDDETFKAYEEAKKLAFERPSLEETSKLGEVVRFDHFKEYNQPRKRKPSFNFLKEIRDPEGFKKAFIMSELLRRKY